MCTLVAGMLGRKEFPPILDKKRHVPHVQLTGRGAGGLQVTLQGLVHSTCGMSAQPTDELFPAGLEATHRLGQHRGSGCLCVRPGGRPKLTGPLMHVQGATCAGGGDQSLGLPLCLAWGWAFRLACFREGDGFPARLAPTKSPQFNPSPWNLAVSVQTK